MVRLFDMVASSLDAEGSEGSTVARAGARRRSEKIREKQRV